MDDELEYGILGRLFANMMGVMGWYRQFRTDEDCPMRRMKTPEWQEFTNWCQKNKSGKLPESIADAMSDLPVVDRRYHLLYLCGRGSWGKVYGAEIEKNGKKRKVAVKIIDPTPRAKKLMEYRQLTLEEALQKEVLPKDLEFVSERTLHRDELGRHYLVMPFYEEFLTDYIPCMHRRSRLSLATGGYALQGIHWLARFERMLGTLSVRRAIRYDYMRLLTIMHMTNELEEHYKSVANPIRIFPLINVAGGLANLHAIGRVHADCKPDNIAVIFGDKGLKGLINDLGTSTEDRWAPNRDNIGSTLTRAPELYSEGSHPTIRSDIWSLGALAYLVVNDKPLLTGAERAALQSDARDLRMLDKTLTERLRTTVVDPSMATFLGRCLAVDPAARYTNAAATVEDLSLAVIESATRELQAHGKSNSAQLRELQDATRTKINTYGPILKLLNPEKVS